MEPNVRTISVRISDTNLCLKTEQICSDFRHFLVPNTFYNRTEVYCLKSERVRISDVHCNLINLTPKKINPLDLALEPSRSKSKLTRSLNERLKIDDEVHFMSLDSQDLNKNFFSG